MKIGINASFLRKPDTGIGQLTINFLQKLMEFQISKSQFPNKLQNPNSKLQKHEFYIYLEEELPKDFKLPRNPSSSAGKFHTRVFLPIWKRDDLVRKIWWEKRLLSAKAQKDGCDVFLSLYQSATVFPKNLKHLMIVHDIIPKLFPEYLGNARKKYYWNLIEEAIGKTDKILAISRQTEKDLVKHLNVSAKKITVNYIDAGENYKKDISETQSQKILKKYKLKPGYILAGGGLEVRKNIEGVIRAYKLLLEENKRKKFMGEFPKLVIFGKLIPRLAPLITDAEKLVKELNLTRYVRLLDHTPGKDMPAIFKNSLMFVYPSFYEGFGIPILEAMNQGMPVVTSKTSSLPEVGADGVLYCDPKDIKDIAMVMKNILLNKDLRATLSRRALERAGKFSWEEFVKKILNIANELSAGKNK
jgi:glycosyltransferase involved in cell wall biosynthesis